MAIQIFHFFLLLIVIKILSVNADMVIVRGAHVARPPRPTFNVTDVHDAPYIAKIYTDGQRRCAGAIIHKRFIATTAQCCEFARVHGSYVKVGSVDDKGGEKVGIYALFLDQNFDPRNNRNDFCLIKLEKYLKWNKKIAPILLPIAPLPDRQTALIHNWGHGHQLKEIRLFHISEERCKQLFHGQRIDDNMLCIGTLNNLIRPCDINLSAPLLGSAGYLHGLASWALECDIQTVKQPIVFTSVFEYLDFIRDITMNCVIAECREKQF